jgi:hypothetical protein
MAANLRPTLPESASAMARNPVRRGIMYDETAGCHRDTTGLPAKTGGEALKTLLAKLGVTPKARAAGYFENERAGLFSRLVAAISFDCPQERTELAGFGDRCAVVDFRGR